MRILAFIGICGRTMRSYSTTHSKNKQEQQFAIIQVRTGHRAPRWHAVAPWAAAWMRIFSAHSLHCLSGVSLVFPFHIGHGHDWLDAIGSGGITRGVDNPKLLDGVAIFDLDVRILTSNGSHMIAPRFGFQSSVYEYETVLDSPMPSAVQLFVSFTSYPSRSAQVLVSGPSVPLNSGGGTNARIVMTAGSALTFPTVPSQAAQTFIVNLPSDGRTYTFVLRSGTTVTPACTSSTRDDGHIKFDGSNYVEMKINNGDYMSLTDKDISSVSYMGPAVCHRVAAVIRPFS
jgi:hypothetical protein